MQKNATVDQTNEVIAVFDGWERYEDRYGVWFKRDGMIKCMHVKLQELQYHTSWDWIVPVVKKIKSMHMDILKQSFIMEYMHAAAPMNSAWVTIDIEKLHVGVYKIITWLNQQKQNDDKDH